MHENITLCILRLATRQHLDSVVISLRDVLCLEILCFTSLYIYNSFHFGHIYEGFC